MARGKVELESFFTKFKSLLDNGYNATLTLESVRGEAFVFLKAGLGPIINPIASNGQNVQPGKGSMYQSQRHRSPSYRRRQERRRQLFQNRTSVKAEEVNPTDVQNSLVQKESEETNTVVHGTEEASILVEPPVEFKCDLCDFKSTWANGLALHTSSMHKITEEKLKSDADVVDMTQQYWSTGVLECNLQVYINALMDVEKANLDNDLKEVEEQKLENIQKELQSTKSNSSLI